jgi:HEAT repeat protein
LALLLRLIALQGTDDPGVLAEAFAGLLALRADDAVGFVAERLAAANRDVARAAAMALGEARRPEAVIALRERLPGEARPDVRHALILALVASRDDAAFDTLLDLVARGSATDAASSAEALRLYAHDAALQGRLQVALDSRRPSAPRPQRASLRSPPGAHR